MSRVQQQTIDGCNETINTIRSAQEKYAETQEHYVSIYVFQSNDKVPSRYLIKNEPVAKVSHINKEQYQPWGCTPLYDAVGSTLADLRAITKSEELAVGSVTIITDGMENASTHYTQAQIAKMIDALKELGWNFNFIGANIDVKATASKLNIDNTLVFDSNQAGTQAMFNKESQSRMAYYHRTNQNVEQAKKSKADKKTLIESLKLSALHYFTEED